METLLIRLRHREPPEHDGDVQWIVLDAGGVPVTDTGRGSLPECAGLARQRRVIALAPVEDITLTTVNIKARNRQQLLKAVPFALEEDIAEDVDAMHFALGNQQGDGRYTVALVSRQAMDAWLGQFSAAGLNLQGLVPEVTSLPLADDEWPLLQEPGRVMARTAPAAGFVARPADTALMLGLALEETEQPPQTIRIHGCDPDDDTLPDLPEGVEVQRDDHCPMELFAEGFAQKPPLNLLQGPYQFKSGLQKHLRPWRAAAALLLVWLVIQLGSTGLDIARLSAEEQRLKTRIVEVYKEAFPDARRIVNPRVQMEQKLKQLRAATGGGGDQGFLALLAAGGEAVRSVQGVAIDSVSYRDGRMEMGLTGKDLQSIEKIKQQLARNGLFADIQSADTSGDRVNARLQIRANKT